MQGQRVGQLGPFALGARLRGGGGGGQNTIKEYKITLFYFFGQEGPQKEILPCPSPKDLGNPGGIQSGIY